MEVKYNAFKAVLILSLACGTAACGGGSSSETAPLSFTVTATAGAGGTISPGDRAVTSGQSTSFTVSANDGYGIASVTGCGGTLNGATYTTASISAACTVTAGFEQLPVSYTVTATAGAGGTISPGDRAVTAGQSTSFTVSANDGYGITSVTGCGGALDGTTFTTAPVSAACTVTAGFELLPVATSLLNGKVIDGYVSGAKVWLDINGNGVQDEDEPSTVSIAAGEYALELTEEQRECVPYATLYVDVPVGAIDEDSGEVTAAYQMARPAQLQPLDEAALLHISPLTSVLWQQVQAQLSNNGQQSLSCADLIANNELGVQISNEVKDIIQTTVSKYNIAADKIFADFIAADDEASYQLAQSIVKGLKAAYAYKQQLKQQHPTANYIRSQFYQGSDIDNNNAYPQAWYRDTMLSFDSGYSTELVKMNDELTEVLRDIYLRENTETTWGAGVLSQTRDIYSYGGDGTDYSCTNTEAVSVTLDGITFGLSNDGSSATAASVAQCVNTSFSNGPYKYYSVDYVENAVVYHTRFVIAEDTAEYQTFVQWNDLQAKAGILNLADLTTHLNNSGYKFDDTVLLDVSSWHKNATDDRTTNRVQVDKYSDQPWEKLEYQADGTYIKTCSTDEGQSWVTCNE
ncbi:hypothetical protein [Rheinheimera sp.]|uniref:InlB B-repeat-containing protein n=1 Tax=Rheinheimera sp. TaxID=1869214 RepID=UPI002733CAF2|nr:hypothetical protein [Rheinheimera sp.]MDP2716514.1 hypothetical protein [Rheinheimera sp.]